MSLTYGYDVKDGDKFLEAPVQASKLLTPLLLPGALLVNHLPFCAAYNFLRAVLVVSHVIFFSAIHSFMGPIPQLRTVGADR
jgi:hypothetical protein